MIVKIALELKLALEQKQIELRNYCVDKIQLNRKKRNCIVQREKQNSINSGSLIQERRKKEGDFLKV